MTAWAWSSLTATSIGAAVVLVARTSLELGLHQTLLPVRLLANAFDHDLRIALGISAFALDDVPYSATERKKNRTGRTFLPNEVSALEKRPKSASASYTGAQHLPQLLFRKQTFRNLF